jgi:hypothetical protein
MRTLIVLIPARREGSETATRSGDNTRATMDNQHFTCRSQSPAPDSSAARPQDTGKTETPRTASPIPNYAPTPTGSSITTTRKSAQPPPTSPLPFCKSVARRSSDLPLLRFPRIRAVQVPRLIRHGILSHMDHATREAFAALTQTVERGFAAVAEDIADIRARMATKDDLA